MRIIGSAIFPYIYCMLQVWLKPTYSLKKLRGCQKIHSILHYPNQEVLTSHYRRNIETLYHSKYNKFLQVCGMTENELRNYIHSWPWFDSLQK